MPILGLLPFSPGKAATRVDGWNFDQAEQEGKAGSGSGSKLLSELLEQGDDLRLFSSRVFAKRMGRISTLKNS